MGVEPFLVSSAITGVVAQRLVRKICPNCKEEYVPEPGDIPSDLKLERGQKLCRGTGCRDCRHTGYRGRFGIFELLVIDDDLREMIVRRKSATELQDHALGKSLKLMREDGWSKVLQGLTTVEEISRVTKLNVAAVTQ